MKITLSISDKEIKKLSEIAVDKEESIAGLLEGFIGDLTDGEHTGGSDERRLANEWLERRYCFSNSEKSFLQYLIEWDNVKCIADNLKRAVELELNLAAASVCGNVTEQEKTEIQGEISSLRGEIEDYYTEYAQTVERPQDYEKATGEIYDYITELDRLRGLKE